MTGAITQHFDVAQVVLYAFWIFFAGLLFYLRQEDRREGYPLESEVTGEPIDPGAVWMPKDKIYQLPHGAGTFSSPSRARDLREIKAEPVAPWSGAPMQPTGDPMLDGVGPASYAQRADVPDLTLEGTPRIAPMRVATDFVVESSGQDLRGKTVKALDGKDAGTVEDIWVDRSEAMIRYLEVQTNQARRVLLPMTMARVPGAPWSAAKHVYVNSITAAQFETVPATKNPDQVTRLEEDMITAYYASGHLYATPDRSQPLL